MSFKDLTNTINRLNYKKGFEDGFNLQQERELFLENTTIKQIIKRKNKRRYIELFNNI